MQRTIETIASMISFRNLLVHIYAFHKPQLKALEEIIENEYWPGFRVRK